MLLLPGREKPAGCLFSKSDIPESFLAQHTKCVKFFMECQKASIERNLHLYENLNEDELEQLYLEQDFCEKRFFEIYRMKPLVRAKRLLKTVKVSFFVKLVLFVFFKLFTTQSRLLTTLKKESF